MVEILDFGEREKGRECLPTSATDEILRSLHREKDLEIQHGRSQSASAY